MLNALEQQHETEHFTQYAKGTRFLLLQREKGHKGSLHIADDSLVMVLEGSFLLNVDNAEQSALLETSDCFTMRKGTDIRTTFLTDTHLMILRTEALSEAYNSLLVRWADLYIDPDMPSFYRLQITPAIYSICRQVILYTNEGMLNHYLSDLKGEELFFLLFATYRKEELARLFRPVMTKYYRPNFRNVITANQGKVRTVNDLIELTRLSKSTFYHRFQEEFGMPAKQWLQQKQIERVAFRATFPGMTNQRLMKECGFKSSPQFYLFCKNHFGITPNELIRRSREGNYLEQQQE